MNKKSKAGLTDQFRPPATKVCTGCKKDKPLKDFYLNGESRDGRHSKCGDCLRAIEQQKKTQRKEKAKTFFDARFFTLFLLLATSLSAFSQESQYAICYHNTLACKCGSGEVVAKDVVKNDTIEVGTGVYMIRHKDSLVGLYRLPTPDTLRAIILVTLSPNGIAHAKMGYVVIERGKRPIYLDCRKRALKWPQVGWDFREVDKNYKK